MLDSQRRESARTGFWLLIGLLALFAASKPILFDTLDPDCFWHLRVAGQLDRDGIGPLVDDLSFASNKTPWTPYSWLAELGMKSVWDWGGYRAAIAVTAVVQGLIVILLAACCIEIQRSRKSSRSLRYAEEPDVLGEDIRRFGVPQRPAWGRNASVQPRYFASVLATTIGTFLILPYLSFRPVTLGFFLLFTIAWLIVRDRKSIWCVVPLTVVLTNIHLFSFFVPAICMAMAMGAIFEHDAKAFLRFSILSTATLLACLATPMLPGLIKTLFFYSSNDKMVTGPVIAEMQSFARGPMGWIAALGVGGMLLCIAWGYRSVRIGQLVCVGISTLLMLKLGRFAPLFALAACPAFAVAVPGFKDRLLAKPVVAGLLAIVLVIGICRVTIEFPNQNVSLAQWVNRHGPDTPGYPCAAADFIEQNVRPSTGHLINEFSWGGYLAWRLDGKYQTLLDGRTQVFPQSLWQAAYLGSEIDRARFLSTVTADAALLPVGRSKFRESLLNLGWKKAYSDNRAEVLIPPSHFARVE